MEAPSRSQPESAEAVDGRPQLAIYSAKAESPADDVNNEADERTLATELKVIAAVLCVLLCAEVAIRTVEDSLSADIRQLKAMPKVPQTMSDSSQPSAVKVLFLGNSITGAGIDADVVCHGLAESTGRSFSVTKVVPDNTRLADWVTAFEQFFVKQDRLPDVVVIGFRSDDLRDQPSRHPARLGRYYGGLGSWSAMGPENLPDFQSNVEFLAGSQSVLFANRKRIRTGVLARAIPGFVNASRAVNRGRIDGTTVQKEGSTTEVPRYERLRDFVRRLVSKKVKVVLLAMHTPSGYEIEEHLHAFSRSESVPLVDMRNIADLHPSNFPDGLHMDGQAARVFSVAAGKVLSEVPALHDLIDERSTSGDQVTRIATRPGTKRQ